MDHSREGRKGVRLRNGLSTLLLSAVFAAAADLCGTSVTAAEAQV